MADLYYRNVDDIRKKLPLTPSYCQSFLKTLLPLIIKEEPFIKESIEKAFDTKIIEDSLHFLTGSSWGELRYLGLNLCLKWKIRGINGWPFFSDPLIDIRMIMVKQFCDENRNKLFGELFKRITDEPRQAVRKAAYSRLRKDFNDLFLFRIENMKGPAKNRFLMTLSDDKSLDKALLLKITEEERDIPLSTALYILMKKEGVKSSDIYRSSKERHLLRYETLLKDSLTDCDAFRRAFEQIDDSAPLWIQDDFLHRLSQLSPDNGGEESLVHAMELISRRSDPFVKDRLREFWDNEELVNRFSGHLKKGFSAANKYRTTSVYLDIKGREGKGIYPLDKPVW